MPLTWDASKVKNWEEVCLVPVGENIKGWSPVTEALALRMMVTGIGWEITKRNAGEFYARCAFVDDLLGPLLLTSEGKERRISTEDVIAHIGLQANVAPESRSAFTSRLVTHRLTDRRREFDRAHKGSKQTKETA